ncbi:hypothetical protein [uncultured Jatrophihabitans sp.]|uniref:hypothetical protein n=1 Tax=uncultured Jatrophihabitans sp. TaxID=1610747 RepID=UPI0035CB14C9
MAWVALELGTAEGMARRPPKVDLRPTPRPAARGGLVLEAAHTLLPEASVWSLASTAKEEVSEGLTGPVRTAFARLDAQPPHTRDALRRRDDRPSIELRDRLIRDLTGKVDGESALKVVARVHLARAVLGVVPLVVEVGCLAWYSAYVNDRWPIATVFRRTATLTEQWLQRPRERTDAEAAMLALAHNMVGTNPPDLLDLSM